MKLENAIFFVLGVVLTLFFLNYTAKKPTTKEIKTIDTLYLPGKDSIVYDTIETSYSYIPKGYVKISKKDSITGSLDTNLFTSVFKDTNQTATFKTYTDGTYVKNLFDYQLFIPNTFRVDTLKVSKVIKIEQKNIIKLHAEFGQTYGLGASYQMKNNMEFGLTYRPVTKELTGRFEIPIFKYD